LFFNSEVFDMKMVSMMKWGLLALAVNVTVAQAGPKVGVTFKNLGSEEAVYHAVGPNGALTHSSADPTPDSKVGAGEVNFYEVRGPLSPDVTTADVEYRIGRKVCKFRTAYVKASRVPQWSKNAVEEYGARCDARITSVNHATHEWTVEFTMR
jgi:hypothetical protein